VHLHNVYGEWLISLHNQLLSIDVQRSVLRKRVIECLLAWRLNPQGFVKTHLEVFEILDVVKVETIDDVVPYFFNNWPNLSQESLSCLPVLCDIVDEVSLGDLECINASSVEQQKLIDDTLIISIVELLAG